MNELINKIACVNVMIILAFLIGCGEAGDTEKDNNGNIEANNDSGSAVLKTYAPNRLAGDFRVFNIEYPPCDRVYDYCNLYEDPKLVTDFCYDSSHTCDNDRTNEEAATLYYRCRNAEDCETHLQPGVYIVEFYCPNYLFVPLEVEVKEDSPTILQWQDGEWGLAPNGNYFDDESQATHEISTQVEDKKIRMDGIDRNTYISGNTWFNGHNLPESEAREKKFYEEGVISEDLKRISWTGWRGGDEPDFDVYITLVE